MIRCGIDSQVNMIAKALLFGIFAMLQAYASAEVDCSVHPNFKETHKCCQLLEPKWPDSCSQYVNANRRNKPSPCLVDCAFNSTNVLVDEKVNIDNLRVLLLNMFAGEKDIADAYEQGISKCEQIVQQRLAELKAVGQTAPYKVGRDNCNTLPFHLGLCAMKEVFVECPSRIWTSTPACENAKEFVRTCEPENGGMRGRHGGGHGGARGGRMGGKRGMIADGEA